MPRAERLSAAEARTRLQLDVQHQRLAQMHAQRRQDEQNARTQRWLLVGRLVDQAGLFGLDDRVLETVFTLLGRLTAQGEIVAALEALVRSREGQP